jgi:hypothetical protein
MSRVGGLFSAKVRRSSSGVAVNVLAAAPTQVDVVGESLITATVESKGTFESVSQPLPSPTKSSSLSFETTKQSLTQPKESTKGSNIPSKPSLSRENRGLVGSRETEASGVGDNTVAARAAKTSSSLAITKEAERSLGDAGETKEADNKKRKKNDVSSDGSQKRRKTMADYARQRDEPAKKDTSPPHPSDVDITGGSKPSFTTLASLAASPAPLSNVSAPAVSDTSSSSSSSSSLSSVASTPSRPSNYRPNVRVVNGNIVIEDHSSLVMPVRAAEHSDYSVVNEHKSRITSRSFTTYSPNDRWSNDETNLFYEGLQQCGTDFTLLQRLFPNKTRRQIRNKYKKEDLADPARVRDALRTRRPIDIKRFAGLGNEREEAKEVEEENTLI